LQHAQVFHSKTTGKEYKIFCDVNCKTPNVVYLLDCHVCGSQYIGESVQPFNKRMNGHRSDLTKKTLLPMSQHFVSLGHSLDDFVRSKIYIIDHNPSWKENYVTITDGHVTIFQIRLQRLMKLVGQAKYPST
jgi:hypothetical protein